MTQKEKLAKAHIMACRIKSIASALRQDARDFGCRFPLSRAMELESIAKEWLDLK
jgi:hypothetical protein